MKRSLILLPLVVVAALLTNSTADGASFARMQEADRVLGKQGTGCDTITPGSIAVDPVTHKVFVSGFLESRVLRFGSLEALQNGAAAEGVLGQPDFFQTGAGTGPDRMNLPRRILVDPAGRLWVADFGNNRVLRFDNAAHLPDGAAADGVLGQPNFTSQDPGVSASQMSGPFGLAADPWGRLWVSDSRNHRVLRFNLAATLPHGANATSVLGQPNFTAHDNEVAANRMDTPAGLAIEVTDVIFPEARLWVADQYNCRVLRFEDAGHLSNGASASGVLGKPDFDSRQSGATASRTAWVTSVAVDGAGRLYTLEPHNHRVLRFDNAGNRSNGASANAVLGQAGFTGRLPHAGHGGLDSPQDLATDGANRLWVADVGNQRALRFEQPHLKVNGGDADSVLGAPELVTNPLTTFEPRGVARDPVSGKLFVSDHMGNRVLRFANASSLASGALPEAVFGQGNFNDGEPHITITGMSGPRGLTVDSAGRLWVVDGDNHRVLRFDNASSRPSGVAADRVLGQLNFTDAASGLGAAKFYYPNAVATDAAGHLWVSDAWNHRVLRFDNVLAKANGAPADAVLGQEGFDVNPAVASPTGMATVRDICHDSAGRLWVADAGNNRVLRYDNAATKTSGTPADGVFGQPDLWSSTAGSGAGSMTYPFGVMLDAEGRLWVADGDNHRILRFNNAASKANGADADGLLGQEDFGLAVSNSERDHFNFPAGLAMDEQGSLWVADLGNYRVLRFSPFSPSISETGRKPDGRFFLRARVATGAAYRIQTSPDLQVWSSLPVFTASSGEIEYVEPTVATGKKFFRIVEP